MPKAAPSKGARPKKAAPGRQAKNKTGTRPVGRAGGKVPAKAGPGGKPGARGPGPSSSGQRAKARKSKRRQSGWKDLFPVHDTDGPRVRFGIGWFLVAFPAIVIAPATTALVFGAAGAVGARQAVLVWRAARWQADLAAGLVAVPVLAALFGVQTGLIVLAIALAVGLVAGMQEPAAGLRGGTGRVAAAGILMQAVGPTAVACGSMVLLRDQSSVVAGMLFLMVCAYDIGDFIIGAEASTPIEGPMAGALAFVLIGFPGALVFLEPFDVMGIWVLIVASLACLFGQWTASAVLPRPDAKAGGLRRVDSLLVLGPLWVAATGAF